MATRMLSSSYVEKGDKVGHVVLVTVTLGLSYPKNGDDNMGPSYLEKEMSLGFSYLENGDKDVRVVVS